MKISLYSLFYLVVCFKLSAEELRLHEPQRHINNIKHHSIAPSSSEGFAEYKIKKNDTLMLIAFEMYSNISRWNEIQELNQEVLEGQVTPPAGKILKLRLPLKLRVYPEGNPYLIKRADTLGKISKKVYGKTKFWRSIYDNNRDQIKNPDLIYAGFTLFYKPFDQFLDNTFATH